MFLILYVMTDLSNRITFSTLSKSHDQLSLYTAYLPFVLLKIFKKGEGRKKFPSSGSGLKREGSTTEKGAKKRMYGNHDFCDRYLLPDNFLAFLTSTVNSYHGYIMKHKRKL